MNATRNPRDKIVVEGISKGFAGQRRDTLNVLDEISLTVGDGEFVSIIGPSGCGKSTLFNVLAGLDRPDAGTITVSGHDATGRRDDFAYMPQKDLLLPWRRVLDNAALGLQVQGVPKRLARQRCAEFFPAFGLEGFEDHWPNQLSGGMRQRVALLRTVVQHRSVLLLDEPFGALDSLTRADMQTWLTDIWQKYHWTVVLITHDIREALLLSDRIYALTSRPAKVRSMQVVNLPRPRTPELLAGPRGVELELELLDALGMATATAAAKPAR